MFREKTTIVGDMLMDEQQLRQLKPELDHFLAGYAPLFERDANAVHAKRFVQGLLHRGERRNAENIAEAMNGGPVRNLQAFLTTGAWSDAVVLARVRQDALEVLAEDDAVWNTDETGFPKKGTKSVGVKRQYSGTLGRTDNCQVAVFANYCSSKGHTFMDRRLFLPQEWADDAERRIAAGVPVAVVFRTKPQLGLAMIAAAVSAGVPFRWVGGDSVYGDSPTYVQGVRELGKWYVVDTSADARVWTEEPQVIPAERSRSSPGGRPRTRPRVATKPRRVDEVVAALPESAFQRVVVAEGSQGPRIYEYAQVWVWFSEEQRPGPRERVLVRRSLGQEPELKYHRSNAPAEQPLLKLAQVRACRWTIEEDIESAKGECGLDEYETRGWVGWHHHTALSMVALLFLVRQKRRLGKKRAADDGARGASIAGSPARRTNVGRPGNPQLVPLASRSQSTGFNQSPQTPTRRVATAAK
ncbi:MAG TPA: IS701 family transposase [Candidatus Limnocylindria bacterium]|nr:IS701 family transposase [Candidatus Limnocylindria bacterium]